MGRVVADADIVNASRHFSVRFAMPSGEYVVAQVEADVRMFLLHMGAKCRVCVQSVMDVVAHGVTPAVTPTVTLALVVGVTVVSSLVGVALLLAAATVGGAAAVVVVTACGGGVTVGVGVRSIALEGARIATESFLSASGVGNVRVEVRTLLDGTGRLSGFLGTAVVVLGGSHAPDAPTVGIASGPPVSTVADARAVVDTRDPCTPPASGATAAPAMATRLAAVSTAAATAITAGVRGAGTGGGARWRPAGGSIL